MIRPTTLLVFTCIIANVLVHQAHSEPQRRQSQSQPGRAERCDPNVCRLPDCYCGGKAIPGGFKPEQIPQFVLLTFDDAINGINKEFFAKLFNERRNPNGCPIKVCPLKEVISSVSYHTQFHNVNLFNAIFTLIVGNILPFARVDRLLPGSRSICRWT